MKTVEIQHNAMYWFSVVLTILFAWIVFPYKYAKKWRHASRKRRAIAKARRMSRKTNDTIYVCQWENEFFVGDKPALKRDIDRKYKNIVSNRISHYLDVDFRNAVIAKAKGGMILQNFNTNHDGE